MALKFCEGFEQGQTLVNFQAKWGAGNGGAGNWVAGRFGGSALQVATGGFGYTISKALGTNQPVWIVGCALKPGGDIFSIFSLYDGGTAQLHLRWANNSGSSLSVVRGDGTTLGTYSASFPVGSWFYVELKTTIATGTGGSITLRVNGVTVLTVTGINTSQSGNAYANALLLGVNNFGSGVWDDLYVCDGTGSVNNDFLGTAPDGARVLPLYPTGAGTTTQLTPNTGTNWAATSDINQNGDTTYVASATVGQLDTYQTTDLPSSVATVRGLQLTQFARKDDTGIRTVAPVLRSGGTNYPQADQALSDSYVGNYQQVDVDPATGVAWTVSGLNALEIGSKVTI